MKREFWAVIIVVAGLVLAIPQRAEAGFYTALSVGGNYNFLVNDPNNSERIGFALEGNLGWRFLIVSLDLGVNYDFIRKEIQWRPGVKVHLGWFYFRAALPFAYDFDPDKVFDLGILVGVGAEVGIGKFAFLAEGNVSPFFLQLNNRGVMFPAELRIGLAYRF